MLTYLLAVPGGLTWVEASTVAFILCLLYAFVCLAAWYPCLATPLDRSSLPRFLFTHVAGALVASALWLLVARVLGRMLAGLDDFHGIDARLSKDFPLLFGTGVLLYLLAVGFHYVLLAVEASREAEARVMQASVLARDAELRALKAQVNPHFLFNSLNSISALTASDAAKAREMCILLGDFLRRTLGLGEKQSIPLEEEMSLVHAFLAVEKIRYGARLQMEESVEEEALAAQVPPLFSNLWSKTPSRTGSPIWSKAAGSGSKPSSATDICRSRSRTRLILRPRNAAETEWGSPTFDSGWKRAMEVTRHSAPRRRTAVFE